MLDLKLNDLLEYTDWERQQWQAWFLRHGDHVLKTSIGDHGDGRFATVGEVVRHIFSAEKRYVDRLSGRPLTDTSTVATDSTATLFQFGEQSRRQLRDFLGQFPVGEWDLPQEFKIANFALTATPRKIVVHVVLHEIRHWAQIATLFRLASLKVEFHDFLFSPVFSSEFRHQGGNV
jgi:uncharacterized damage-inducible protein DinB